MAYPARKLSADSDLVWHLHPTIMHWPKIRIPHKAVWLMLWNEAGCGPGKLSTNTAYIAGVIGEDDRRVREWMRTLEQIGAFIVLDRHRAGATLLYLQDPDELAIGRIKKHDGQRELFDDDGLAENVPPAPETVRIPAPESGRKTAPDSTSGMGEGWGPGDSAPESVRKTAPPFMDSIEDKKSISSSPHRTARSMKSMKVPAEKDGHAGDDDRMRGGFAEARNGRNGWMESTKPQIQKENLLREIRQAVRDPEMDASIPGRAADLVVYGYIDYVQLRAILKDIEGTRRSFEEGTGKGFKTSPGAYFLFKLRQLSAWNEPKSRRTDGQGK